MADFHDTPTHPVARKPHRCIWCFAAIPVGERYTQQSGFYDGRAYRSRYHDECFDDLADGSDFEFTPGCGDVPERLRAAQTTGGGNG